VRDVLYDDGGVVLDDDGLTIRRYYFPWAGPKHIPYSAIRHVVAKLAYRQGPRLGHLGLRPLVPA